MIKAIFLILFMTITVFGQTLRYSTMDIPKHCHEQIQKQNFFDGPFYSTRIGLRVWRWDQLRKAVKQDHKNICYYYTFNQAAKEMALYWLGYAQRKGCFSDGHSSLPLEAIDLSENNRACPERPWKSITDNLNYIKLQQNLFDHYYKGEKGSYSRPSTSSKTNSMVRFKPGPPLCFKPIQQLRQKVPQVASTTLKALGKIPNPCQENPRKAGCPQQRSKTEPTLRDRCLNPYNTMCSDSEHTQKVEKVKHQFNSLFNDDRLFSERDQFLSEFHQECGKKRIAEEKQFLHRELGIIQKDIDRIYTSSVQEYAHIKDRGRLVISEHFSNRSHHKSRALKNLDKLQRRFLDCGPYHKFPERGAVNKFGCAEIPQAEYPNKKKQCVDQFVKVIGQRMEKAFYTKSNKQKAERVFGQAKAKLLAYLSNKEIIPNEKARKELLKRANQIGLSFGTKNLIEKVSSSGIIGFMGKLGFLKSVKDAVDSHLPELTAFACPTKFTGPRVCLEGAIFYDEALLEKVFFREFGHLVSGYAKQTKINSWNPIKISTMKMAKHLLGQLGDIEHSPFKDNFKDCFQDQATLRNQNVNQAIGSVADMVAAQLMAKDLQQLSPEKRWDYMRGHLALKCLSSQIFTKAEDMQKARKDHADSLAKCQAEGSWKQFVCSYYNMPSDSINLIYHAQPKVIKLLGCHQYVGEATNYGDYPPQTCGPSL